jgi:hypothetical protein
LAQSALIRPTLSVGRDMRDFDDKVLAHLVGMPERHRGGETWAATDQVIRAHGLAGRFLAWLADHLQGFETNLVMQQGAGPWTRTMRRIGDYLLVLEALIERPRYMILLVVATFVVIL